MRRVIIGISALVLVGGFLVWWMSPKEVVKRRVTALTATLTMDEGSRQAGRQMAGYSFGAMIADELVLETPMMEEANGTFQRSEVESGFSWLASQAKFTKFKIERFDTVEVNRKQAKVRARIESVVALPEYRPADGIYEVEMDWRREKDGWRMERAKWAETR